MIVKLYDMRRNSRCKFRYPTIGMIVKLSCEWDTGSDVFRYPTIGMIVKL